MRFPNATIYLESQSGDRLADSQNLMFLDSVTRLTPHVRDFRFVCLFVGFFVYHHSILEICLYANVN